jgi:hypothetical protein
MAYVGKEPKPKFLGQVDDLDVKGNAVVEGNATVKGDLNIEGTTVTIDSASVQTVDLGDNDKIRLGDSDDAQLYHDGSDLIINNDTGDIAITGANVGIGTSSPEDNGSDYGDLTIGGSTGGYVSFTDGGVLRGEVGTGGTTMYVNAHSSVGNLVFGTNGGTERMRIDSSGDVSIGTTGSGYKLEVENGSDANIILRVNGADDFSEYVALGVNGGNGVITGGGGGATTTGLSFHTASSGSETEQMRLTGAGNLQFNSGYGSVATAYGCRAWVNFTGVGTPNIRNSGNVSSITDNGTGDYTVNFTTAMPDANYAVVNGSADTAASGANVGNLGIYGGSYSASSFRGTAVASSGSVLDRDYMSWAFFR